MSVFRLMLSLTAASFGVNRGSSGRGRSVTRRPTFGVRFDGRGEAETFVLYMNLTSKTKSPFFKIRFAP